MPRKRKRKSRFRRFLRGAGRVMGVAGKALAIARSVKSLLNVEYKYADTMATGTLSALATGDIFYLSGCNQGDDSDERVGNSVKAKSFHIRMSFNNNLASHCLMRVIIFKDTMVQGAANAPTPGNMVVNLNSVTRMRNITDGFGKRFRILMDKTFKLGKVASVEGGSYKFLKFNKKLGHHVKYVGTTDAAADAGPGSIWMFVHNSNASSMPVYDFSARMRFIDN